MSQAVTYRAHFYMVSSDEGTTASVVLTTSDATLHDDVEGLKGYIVQINRPGLPYTVRIIEQVEITEDEFNRLIAKNRHDLKR